jgi:acetoin utilization deacetylase AcuC-like enzyme/nucleotide-binding universal stress UspA family protein
MESILCSVDLSPTSKPVAAWAVMFARRLNLPLLLFHAIHEPYDPLHPSMEFERGGDLARRRARSSADIEALMQSADVTWRLEIASGDPAEMVQQYCRTHRVALVVAGSQGVSGLKRFFLGTVVERMARMLPCPMLVVRPDRTVPLQIRTVGVCCDRSETGRVLVTKAAALALRFNAELLIFSALEAALDPVIGESVEVPYGEAQSELQMRWQEKLASMVPSQMRDALKVTAHLAFGEALDEIPDLVRDCRLDLLIVGVRNRSTLGQWMAGSTTETLLRQAPCQVLAVPSGSLTLRDELWGHPNLTPPSGPTGIVRDNAFLAHRCAGHHPENHKRLESIYAMLDETAESLPLTFIASEAASLENLTLVHDLAYVLRIAATAKQDYTQLTPDTYACSRSYEAASRAAGAVMAAIDAVVDGDLRNAFVPIRPPGHHAEVSRALGFCLFNNVALGAEYARAVKGLQRVLVVDWDLHHGNGIQHFFEEDPSVLYISTHQYPCFPGTGHYLEMGRGRGEGYTINLPLGKGWGDGDYVALYRQLVAPVALGFDPDLILVAAGFDIHKQDPVGRMRVTENGFAALTRILMDVAQACCQDRLVLVLEGGYHATALSASVRAVLTELSDQTHADPAALAAKAKVRRVRPVIKRCCHVHGHIWPCLRK